MRGGHNEFGVRYRAQTKAQGMFKKSAYARLVVSGCRAHEVGAGVSLRVQVHHQGAQPLARTDGRQVAGNGGLANSPFLIENDA